MPLFGACRVHNWINTETNEQKFGVQAYVELGWRHVTPKVGDVQTPMLFDTAAEAQKAAEKTQQRLRRIPS